MASRLTELYYKPSVVLTLANGLCNRLILPVQGFDIYKAVDSTRDLLENFGGHTYAVGFRSRKRISRSSHAGSRNMYRPISSPHS